jgi:lipoprotein-anchoring transpeptidase ErfK/SrfK
LNAPPSLVLLVAGGEMLFRATFTTISILIGLAGLGSDGHAQSYPSRGYPPPQGYPRQPEQPAWYGQGEGDSGPDIDRVVRPPESPNAGRDAGITGSTRGESGGFAGLPPEVRPETGPAKDLPSQFRRTLVDYYTKEPAGTIIVDTPNTHLYLTLGNGKALRYGIGVGREGFTWSGSEKVSRMAEWPDWNPPEQMIERQPYLPRFMAGGEGNPLGSRALYLGDTLFRIHGTNQPSTIGTFVSSGCIRLTNDDITDLYRRVKVGTRVVVLSANGTPPAQSPSVRRTSPPTTSGANTESESSRKRKSDETAAKSQQALVPERHRSAEPKQTEASSYRSQPETVMPNQDKDAHRGSFANTGQNGASLSPDNPLPARPKQEASAFEE